MDRELKRGTLEMVLLRLLSERPMYGYELTSELRARSAGLFELKEGTLYPVLYRLEEAGQVTTEWQTPERGVPRKYYVITESGGAELERQLEQWRTFVVAVSRLIRDEQGVER
jgi:PadR family transcriptional regulator, regulatory protein PadR